MSNGVGSMPFNFLIVLVLFLFMFAFSFTFIPLFFTVYLHFLFSDIDDVPFCVKWKAALPEVVVQESVWVHDDDKLHPGFVRLQNRFLNQDTDYDSMYSFGRIYELLYFKY